MQLYFKRGRSLWFEKSDLMVFNDSALVLNHKLNKAKDICAGLFSVRKNMQVYSVHSHNIF